MRQQIEDLSLAAEVKAALIELKPDIEVTTRQGTVRVTASASPAQQSKLEKEMRKVSETIPGIKNLEMDLLTVAPYSID